MLPPGYPDWVKTIEAVRLTNYRRLVAELQADTEGPIRPVDIARALGISKVYAWQLENGKRDAIDSKAARLMEREMEKPEGWMDTDFDLWPFPDASLLQRVERLGLDQRIEVQYAIRRALSDLGIAGEGSGKSSPSPSGDGRRNASH
jgi:transcriptional regulator with XRE-family HTH domain